MVATLVEGARAFNTNSDEARPGGPGHLHRDLIQQLNSPPAQSWVSPKFVTHNKTLPAQSIEQSNSYFRSQTHLSNH